MMKRILIAIAPVVMMSAGCSTVMEARRPDPVDLRQFSIGDRRFDIVTQIGAPLATETEGSESCDVYKLVTHGVHRAGKAAIILGEAAADVYTLGLFEVIATPVEGATASAPHTVAFCYSADRKLQSISESRPGGPAYVLGQPLRAGATRPPAAPTATIAQAKPNEAPDPASGVAVLAAKLTPPAQGSCLVPQSDGIVVKMVRC